MKMRRIAVSALAAGLLVSLTACNSDDQTDGSASDASHAAALTKQSFAQSVMAAQADAKSAHVEATVEAQGQKLKLSGDIAGLDHPSSTSMDLAADFGGQHLQLLALDKVLYVRGDGLSGSKGKPWLKIDLSDPNNPMSQIFDAANPGNFAAYLNGITAFDAKGKQTVDGVQAQHYSVTVDTAKMMAANPVFKGQDAATFGLPDQVTSQVYVDGDNRPVAMNVDLGSTGAFEVHFSDYGKSVSVQAPPASEVGDFSL
ncbi:MAG: LppX_LprAFG lipoprotein [Nocardioidaceae bacterium]